MLQNQPPATTADQTFSEVQTALAGGVGQRLDAAVIDVGAAVEDDLLDAGLRRRARR